MHNVEHSASVHDAALSTHDKSSVRLNNRAFILKQLQVHGANSMIANESSKQLCVSLQRSQPLFSVTADI
jgi:hypothetical protein